MAKTKRELKAEAVERLEKWRELDGLAPMTFSQNCADGMKCLFPDAGSWNECRESLISLLADDDAPQELEEALLKLDEVRADRDRLMNENYRLRMKFAKVLDRVNELVKEATL